MSAPTDGRILDATPDDYYADRLADGPMLNASTAKILLADSPRHAWHQHPRLNPEYAPSAERKFDLGTVAHEIFLRDNEQAVAVIDAADWRTKAAKEAAEEARANGRTPILAAQWDGVRAMVDALRDQIAGVEADPPLFCDGTPERTVTWRDRDVWCRARIDWLRDDLRCADDLKTAKWTANPAVWARRTLWSIGADVQAAFYLRALRALGATDPEFRLAVIETEPPYALSVVQLAPDALTLADAKADRAIDLWAECLRTGVWPGYPAQVCHAELPPWEEARFLEQRALIDMGEDVAA